MTADITFYTNPQSRGRIARWMLEETGQPYRVELIEYGAAMKSAEFLAINPMGKVPVIRHGEHIVTETAAICAYLADAFPQAGLAPTGDERANYYRWLFFTAGPLEAALTNKSIFGSDPAPDKQGMAGYGNYATAIDVLSHAVKANPYIAGARFTAADVYVGSQVGWGLQFGTIDKRPEFVEYFARISERAAFLRASELDNALAAEPAGS
ncbi:glutathione S-transferase family protein [Microbulbifer yueqingensis]|uniref:Glutathione S-transferase n=1 Tax=Microbulbifer yueqingensis TaxID=658219 RepID=A0A1G9BSY3_9GAMM|nr:glutathione S-transferase family protein [Microbulbifer yueqingensis]SDK42075.1 glutathione S-transferase [Microbulbifer yueqingensis]